MRKLAAAIVLFFIGSVFSDSEYTVSDQSGIGRQFDGIGGLSGGGPNFGASLQILKVEIGGDDQSTDGTEASHMHEEWDENYNRGYEWWLMKEAKMRNPDIKLWGLSWAWPHWLGDPDTKQPYKNLTKTAMYITNWITGAYLYHNLTIDYIGIWNEKYCNFDYILTLRQALNANNLTKNVQIVACDTKYYDFYRLAGNTSVSNAVYAFGSHYPGTNSPSSAIASNITLWSSEDYSTFNDDTGAGCWARTLNQNYVNGYLTSTISWNLIASYYFGLPYKEDGLMTAVQPWSGYYEVKNPIWITAHTTQFTEIGWKYLNHGTGVGKLDGGGSYVTLISPDSKQLTLIIETMSHDHSVCIRPPLPKYNVSRQSATFTFGGSFSKLQTLWLWRTELNFNGSASIPFKPYGLVAVTDGSISLDLEVDNVYTLTTVDSGNHGDHADNSSSSPFPLPYEDNFENYTEGQEPYYLAPQVGSWEIYVNNIEGSKFARQSVVTQPVPWCGVNPYPIAVIGDSSWTDINVTATLGIPDINGTDSMFVAAQIDASGWKACDLYATKGIFFWLDLKLSTYQISADITRFKILASGVVSPVIQPNQYNTLSLVIRGETVTASINGIQQTTITIKAKNGFVGLGSGSYGYSDIGYLGISVPD